MDAPIEAVSLGIGRSGAAPVRVQGVPPSAAAAVRPGQYVWAERRPIFTAPMGDGRL